MIRTYKNFNITVNFGEESGFTITRDLKGRSFLMLSRNFHFGNPDEALQRACNHIDKFENELNEKFKTDFIDFCKEVHDKMNVYAITKLDFRYFVNCHYKILELDKNKESH